MGKFLTPLRTEQISEATLTRKARFRLTSTLIYESKTLNQIIIVPEGFITDFATVPRIPIVYMLLGNLGNAAAALHDFLYTYPHLPSHNSKCDPVTRELADKVLQGAIVDGMIKDDVIEDIITVTQSIKNIGYIIIGLLFFIGVRIGGSSHWGQQAK